MKCKAFTLAEILITLGIIGVVAAIITPYIFTKYQKKITVEKLKTTYSILAQAVDASKSANGEISSWDTSLNRLEFVKKYIAPHLTIAKTITNNKDRYNLYTLSNQYDSNSIYLFWSWNVTTSPLYVLANGSIFHYAYAQDKMWIVIDINGKQKPNVMGIDGFSFNIDPQTNQLIPTGYGNKREQLTGKTYYTTACIRDNQWQYYRGGSCAALIMMDGWEIKNDYPWGNGYLTPIKKD